jgi:hypothetical protein
MATRDQLKQALVQADQAGDKQAAELFANRIKSGQFEEVSGFGESLAQGIAQGATLGFHDEAAAALRAGTGEFFDKYLGSTLYGLGVGTDGGEGSFLERFKQYKEMAEDPRSLGEKYQTALESQRGALEAARKEDPWTTGLGELAGGLVTGGAGAARAVAGQGVAKGTARLAGAGAGIGGAAGYGMSEGDPLAAIAFGEPEDIKREALEAGKALTVGAGVGAAGGAIVPGASAGLRALGRVVSRPFTAKSRLTEVGRRQVAEAIQKDIDAGFITRDQAKQELASTPGMTLADLGPSTRALTETIATTPTVGGRKITEQLKQRSIDQYDRIMPEVSKALGRTGAPSMFHHHAQDIMKSAKDAADPMYKQAYATNVRVTRQMNDILHGTKTGKVGMNEANKLAKELRKKVPAIGKLGTFASTERLDLIIQSMDDHVNKLFTGGKSKLGQAAKDLRNEFREIVYQANPALRDARQKWAGFAQSDEALKQGRRVFKDDFDFTAGEVRKMSEGERTYFRVGVLKEIENRLANKIDTADITQDLLHRRKVREALSVAFGSKEKFDGVMDLLGREAKMQQTFREATGNSRTALRMAQGTDFGEKLAALAGYGVSLSSGLGIPPSIGGYLARKGYQASGAPTRAQQTYERVAREQADMLMGQDLGRVMQPKTMGGLLETGAPVKPAQMLGGLLATGGPPEVTGMGVEYGGRQGGQ